MTRHTPGPAPPDPDDDDAAVTRAITEPMPKAMVMAAQACASGTEPPRPRAPSSAPASPAAKAVSPTSRTSRFGDTTLLIVPAGDHVAIVIPGVVRLTGSVDEVAALAAALTAAGQIRSSR
jgi:hypothetical protein